MSTVIAGARLRARLIRLLPSRADWIPARRDPRRDLLAGVAVAVVALPLALAFGVSSGMGAQAGLVTAIVAGVLAAVFGGSNLQVSGPTGRCPGAHPPPAWGVHVPLRAEARRSSSSSACPDSTPVRMDRATSMSSAMSGLVSE